MKKSLMIAAAAALMFSGFAATDAVAGAEGKCKACHTFDKGGKNKTGPNLFGVVGRKKGSVADFKYGSFLESENAKGATWDEAGIRAWIENSKDVAKAGGGATKMPPQKMTGAKADEIIKFLKGLK